MTTTRKSDYQAGFDQGRDAILEDATLGITRTIDYDSPLNNFQRGWNEGRAYARRAMATKAWATAKAYGDRLKAGGWRVEYTVSIDEPERMDDGEVLIDGRSYVHMHAEREWFEGGLRASWVTRHGEGAGNKATTRYLGGERRHWGSTKVRKIATLKSLASWIATITR